MSKWANFAKIDAASINEEVKTLDGGEFPEVPNGKYEVEIVSMELKPTKEKGYPMLSVQFAIVEGEYKKQRLFMNQVLIMGDQNDKYRVNSCNKFLKSLGTDYAVHFEGVEEYDALVQNIFDDIESMKLQYLLEVGEKKGYRTFDIKEVYEG